MVYIPQLVIDELVAHRRRQLEATLRTVCQNIRKLSNLVHPSDTPPNHRLQLPNVESQIRLYCTRLNTLFRNRFVRIFPYPSIRLRSLVQAAGRRIPPFDNNGNNFRDYLIWCNIKSLADSDIEVHFVTGDKKAFGDDKKDRLLCQVGSASCVFIHYDMQTLIVDVVHPQQVVKSELRRLTKDIQEGRIPQIELLSVIESKMTSLLPYEIAEPDSVDLPVDSDGASIESYLSTIEQFDINELWKTKSETIMVEIELKWKEK